MVNALSGDAADVGFTLIELAIVLVILGILAGLSVFTVSQFQSDSKTTCTRTNDRIGQSVTAAQDAAGNRTFVATTGSC